MQGQFLHLPPSPLAIKLDFIHKDADDTLNEVIGFR
jgi:hypothetical protein